MGILSSSSNALQKGGTTWSHASSLISMNSGIFSLKAFKMNLSFRLGYLTSPCLVLNSAVVPKGRVGRHASTFSLGKVSVISLIEDDIAARFTGWTIFGVIFAAGASSAKRELIEVIEDAEDCFEWLDFGEPNGLGANCDGGG